MQTRTSRRLLPAAIAVIALMGAGCADNPPSQAAASASETGTAAMPDQQDDGHRRLNQLVGEWSGAKSTFVAGGTADNPMKHDIVSRWHWITKTGSNFLQEEAESNVGSEPYYRLGLLGYSPTDDRYEWTTVDSITPMTMGYRGTPKSGGSADISMNGEFTDPGVLGTEFVGKTIPMRTLIELDTPDHAVMEIYFYPPGRPELLADRVVLTRQK